MPAQEDTYRNQKVLHIVFAVSSILMFVSITWMMADDHLREWKKLQRDFIRLDAAKTQHDQEVAQQLASRADLRALEAKLSEAEKSVAASMKAAQEKIDALLGHVQKKDEELSFKKADRDSIQSKVDIAIDEGNGEETKRLREKLDKIDAELDTLRRDSEALNADLKKARDELATAKKPATEIQADISRKQKEIDRLNQKKWSGSAAFRALPVIDAFQSPTKIDQTVLSDLTIHYSFKGVPRFDRCTTCHRAIDLVTKEGGPQYDDEVIKQVSEATGWDSPYKAAFKTHPHPELFAGPNSPHPREKFGCTVCHMGQGSGTSFLYASHSPNNRLQEAEWKENYGWEIIHHWPYPMHKARFAESGCVKCHPHVVDLDSSQYGNTASKLLKGYNLVRQYGCFGCHEITGWKNGRLIGPDLRLEPQTDEERAKAAKDPNTPPGRMRKVGPSLRHIAQKTTPEWTFKWVKLPRGFRPETRMPQFYGLSNNNGKTEGSDPHDVDRSDVEIHAIVHYLYSTSTDAALADVPESAKLDPGDKEQTDRGHQRFIERGCLACHSHSKVSTSDYPNATADFGPALSNVAAKLRTADGKPNVKWLFNWLKDPTVHHTRAFMPNLQLKDEEAADIAAWLLSVEGGWANDPGRPELDTKTLDDILRGFLQKSMTLQDTEDVVNGGLSAEKAKDTRGDEKMLQVAEGEKLSQKKLLYLGKKTISRMGCFGCHDIPGFETAKTIGTELNVWGIKARLDPDKLDFAHIVEYLEKEVPREAKNAEFELFADGLKEHSGPSFLWQKLRDPRSYDYKKFKKPEAWDEKLRMPRFPFADNPADVEAIMTFILGLVADDSIPQHYRSVPQAGPKLAKIEGAKALDKFNCRGCHMLKMPEFTFDPAKAELRDPESLHREDFPAVGQDQAAMTRSPAIKSAKPVTILAMLVGADGENRLEQAGQVPTNATDLALDLWEPVKVENKQYFVGDKFLLTVDSLDRSKLKPADGGTFADLLVTHMMRSDKAMTVQAAWNRVPPPLVREGMKAQPAWLHQFLLNPAEIRPAVPLRMPQFNMSSDEAASLAGYFAAVDGVDYPYEYVRQREPTYLAEREQQHAGYLRDAWKLLTARGGAAGAAQIQLCTSCHAIANVPPGGKPEERGPNLRLTPDRLRPEWLRQWITAPNRLLPYTAMPKNFPPGPLRYQEVYAGSLTDQIIAVRDTLMNYHRVQQDELASQSTQPSTGGN